MGKKKVLVIDDEEDICLYLKETLDEAGYESFVAYDGIEGLASFEQNNPDLVILDMNMPKMSGTQFYEKLAEKGQGIPSVPIIVLTGHREMEYSFEDGSIYAFITKPIDLDDFMNVVNQVFNKE